MGKFLRVLVVLIFLLTIVSLVLAVMLFNKREIIKGRTHELEEGLIKIARTIEAEPPAVPEDPADYPARDISECTAEAPDTVEKSDFWKNYKQQLESLDQKVLDIDKERRDLMSYYKIDPATGKPVRDVTTGLKVREGEGTTQGVIDKVLARAEAQYDLLTETRQQLEDIRTELVDTIKELNGRKATLREKMAKIVDLTNQITELNNTISNLRQQIEEQQNQIQTLEGDIANLQQEKRKLEEDNEGLKLAKEEMKETIKDLRSQLEVQANGPGGGVSVGEESSIKVSRLKIEPGVKGKIVAVDERHQFVVARVDQKFGDELQGAVSKGALPYLPLMVLRGNSTYVSKIKIKQFDSEKRLIIGDILIDWQQKSINVGDVIYYQ